MIVQFPSYIYCSFCNIYYSKETYLRGFLREVYVTNEETNRVYKNRKLLVRYTHQLFRYTHQLSEHIRYTMRGSRKFR